MRKGDKAVSDQENIRKVVAQDYDHRSGFGIGWTYGKDKRTARRYELPQGISCRALNENTIQFYATGEG